MTTSPVAAREAGPERDSAAGRRCRRAAVAAGPGRRRPDAGGSHVATTRGASSPASRRSRRRPRRLAPGCRCVGACGPAIGGRRRAAPARAGRPAVSSRRHRRPPPCADHAARRGERGDGRQDRRVGAAACRGRSWVSSCGRRIVGVAVAPGRGPVAAAVGPTGPGRDRAPGVEGLDGVVGLVGARRRARARDGGVGGRRWRWRPPRGRRRPPRIRPAARAWDVAPAARRRRTGRSGEPGPRRPAASRSDRGGGRGRAAGAAHRATGPGHAVGPTRVRWPRRRPSSGGWRPRRWRRSGGWRPSRRGAGSAWSRRWRVPRRSRPTPCGHRAGRWRPRRGRRAPRGGPGSADPSRTSPHQPGGGRVLRSCAMPWPPWAGMSAGTSATPPPSRVPWRVGVAGRVPRPRRREDAPGGDPAADAAGPARGPVPGAPVPRRGRPRPARARLVAVQPCVAARDDTVQAATAHRLAAPTRGGSPAGGGPGPASVHGAGRRAAAARATRRAARGRRSGPCRRRPGGRAPRSAADGRRLGLRSGGRGAGPAGRCAPSSGRRLRAEPVVACDGRCRSSSDCVRARSPAAVLGSGRCVAGCSGASDCTPAITTVAQTPTTTTQSTKGITPPRMVTPTEPDAHGPSDDSDDRRRRRRLRRPRPARRRPARDAAADRRRAAAPGTPGGAAAPRPRSRPGRPVETAAGPPQRRRRRPTRSASATPDARAAPPPPPPAPARRAASRTHRPRGRRLPAGGVPASGRRSSRCRTTCSSRARCATPSR